MAYYGNAPADVALVVGQDVITTTEIQDATIATADIASDAITATKIDDDGTGFQMGSLGLGTAVSGSHKLTVGGTATFSGDITGTLATASQTNITSVGTLTGLTVQGSNYTTLSIQAGTTSHGAILNLGDSGDIDYGSITQFGSGAGEGGRMRFKAGTTEVLNLYSNGNSTFAGQVEIDGSYLQIDNGGVRIDRHSNPPYILMEYDGTGVAQLRGVSGGGLNITNGGAGTTWQSFDSSGNATFNQNIITKSESNHTFTSSGTDNVAIKRQVWYSSYSSHNFQLSTTDSGSSKYLILSTIGSNGHIDWKISGSRMSQVYASITFTNYADASGRTAYLEWSDDEGQNWNTVDTHGSWGAGSATVSATINTANGSSQTGGSSSGSSSGSNQIIIRGRFVGGGGSYIGITNVTIKPTASYWTFVPVPRGYYNTTVSGITASTKTVQGTWTKTGRQVFIQAYITIDGKSGGSGNPYIALPFTPSDIGVPASTVGANIHKNTSISNLVYFGLYGANAQIYANNGNGGYIGHSDWANGVVGFTLTYNAL